ncbi:MAG: hypothetical protein CMJ35_10185 [Phycisphaerae bacterium]|nr:hypothetical protein [Phycisphaerae bacterium]MBM91965.1 hypothetical protein [Phycisphaerae bacterium]HCT43662.1 hypothetical protein [Phycisphaerales bacterium]|tara:strand:+ start:239 stop:421 length:183 start_codon:yes stop_codon:yes gene_type:complete
MNTLGPLILLSFAFALLLLGRIVILLVLRSGETTKRTRPQTGEPPTVIHDELFADHTNPR